jgi:hypothetical protein
MSSGVGHCGRGTTIGDETPIPNQKLVALHSKLGRGRLDYMREVGLESDLM